MGASWLLPSALTARRPPGRAPALLGPFLGPLQAPGVGPGTRPGLWSGRRRHGAELLEKLPQKGSRGCFSQLTPPLPLPGQPPASPHHPGARLGPAARSLTCSFASSLPGCLSPLPGWRSVPASHTQSWLPGYVQHTRSVEGGAAVQPRLALQADRGTEGRAVSVASGALLPGALRPRPHLRVAAAP